MSNPSVSIGRTPFTKAIEYFKAKTPRESQAYTDLLHEQHDNAFVIAGCTNVAVVSDVQNLLTKALETGQPFEQWQKEFNKTINGRWLPTDKTGEPNSGWRARVIYETNMKTAYAAGRYKQMMDMKETHPFWQYKHGDSLKPRQEHVALHNKIVRADDPWWDEHYPPNGWGCTCYVRALSQGDIDRMNRGKTKSECVEVTAGNKMPQVKIDPHWAYAPGKQHYEHKLEDPGGKKPVGEDKDPGEWVSVTGKDWGGYEPDVALKEIKSVPKPPAGTNISTCTEAIAKLLGAPEKMLKADMGGGRTMPILVNAKGLGGHLKADRIPYMGFLKEVIERPQEVWLKFMARVGGKQHGKLTIRRVLVSTIKVGQDKGMVFICEVNSKGVLQAYTYFPKGTNAGFNSVRDGVLVFRRQGSEKKPI